MIWQYVRVAGFVAVVASIYVVELRELTGLVRRALARCRAGAVPEPAEATRSGARHRRFAATALHVLAVLGLVCFAWGAWVEPTWIEVTFESYSVTRPGGAAGRLRIVHLTDLHFEVETARERELADRVNALKPDLIVLTGDLLNADSGRPLLRRALADLRAPLGVVLARGNWDAYRFDPMPEVEGAGVRWLDREALVVTTPLGRIQLIGLEWDGEGDLVGLLKQEPEARARIVLCHVPDAIEQAAAAGADFYFAGHTHGGQVCLPGYGALITFSAFDKKYESGRYRVGELWGYVSRGIGMEGGHAPRVRFCCRPQIVVHDLEFR